MTLVPRLWNWSFIYFFKPKPKAVKRTTAITPIKIPKDVKKVRPLLLEKLNKADLTINAK
jgi:hypothetical protein